MSEEINIKKPLFIVFEGIDGSGKSTQADLLYNYLKENSVDAIKLFEPTDGKWGKEIRKILKGDESPPVEEILELFIRDREDDVQNNITSALENNKIIIMDRYMYSNAAYQGAMNYDPEKIIEMNLSKKFPIPDRVYLIDIDPEVAFERISKRNKNDQKELFEKKSFLSKVQKNYEIIKKNNFLSVDGEKDINSMFNIIKQDFLKQFSN